MFRAEMTLVLLLPLLAGTVLAAESAAERWWAHVAFLADDRLEGRTTGSEGHRKAVEYVVSQFKRAGLAPGGSAGYRQPVRFRVRHIVEDRSRLALVRDGVSEPIILGDEAAISMRVEPAATLKAPLVFAGHGLRVPEAGHDDLAGLDARGKIVVYLTGGPAGIPGPLLAHYQSAGERWAFLGRAGAIGTIGIQNPRGQDIPWERATLARLQPSMALADRSLGETEGQRLSVTMNPDRAEKLFAGSGRTFKEILGLANAHTPLPRFPLPASLDAAVAFSTSEVSSDNVVGILPGTDPVLKGEYVVVSAHLDHLGSGTPIDGDAIHNGAMDNASGVATLIEMAAALTASPRKLRRSVIFLAVTAEEKGLLGSRYFAAHPTVAPGAIVANVNLDMFLPLFPLKSVVAQGLQESDLGDVLREVVKPLGIEALTDPEPERNAFVRSDQYSFIRRGVPALSLKVGFARDSPEAAIVRRWRTERYHAPSDDLRQPLDLDAAVGFNRVVAALVDAIANRPERPRWNADSFFRRFAELSPEARTAR